MTMRKNRLPSFLHACVRPALASWRIRAGVEDRVSEGARSVFTSLQRIGLFAAVALLTALRIPNAWRHGRFLNEEGTIFFAFAWHRSAGEALWRSFGGYLNLGANAATLGAARLVQSNILPLQLAPYLTMTTALLFQLLPALLILSGSARWLANRWAVIAALLILAITPLTEEVFFNVLHIQFHLALCTALILAIDPPQSRAARIGYMAILIIAPLCGPGAIILAPFFGLRGMMERDPARLVQTAAIAAGVLLQLALFVAPNPARGQLLDPATIAAIMFVRLVALPVAGWWNAERLGGRIHAAHLQHGIGWWWVGVAGAAAYFGLLIWLALRDRRDSAVWLIVPGLVVAAVSFGGGSISMGLREWFSPAAGERYNFLPLVMISFGLIALAARGESEYRLVPAVLCILTLVSGAVIYIRPIAEVTTGAVWSDEVRLWRGDHNHELAAWPATWTVDLSDRHPSCPSPGAGRIAAASPSYCESAWLTRVMLPASAKIRGR